MENHWTISVKSVTALNNIALQEIRQKQQLQRQQQQQENASATIPNDGIEQPYEEPIGSPISPNINPIIDNPIAKSIYNCEATSLSIANAHICPRCDKMYTYKKNLSRHLRFECGVSPSEKCPCCSYVTRYKHSLNVHVKTQHPKYVAPNDVSLTENDEENNAAYRVISVRRKL